MPDYVVRRLTSGLEHRSSLEGANVVLLRGQDWDRGWGSGNLRQDQTRVDERLAEYSRRVLPNGLEIAHLNQYETYT